MTEVFEHNMDIVYVDITFVTSIPSLENLLNLSPIGIPSSNTPPHISDLLEIDFSLQSIGLNLRNHLRLVQSK